MPFDYEANVAAVVQALTDHNTTTASPDLSSGMTTRVQNIYSADPETVSKRADSFPAIFVRISTKDEEYASLGQTGPTGNKKMATVTYDVFAFYKKDGTYTQNQTLLTEVYRLAENIEGVFQAEMKLSNTALWCNPLRSEFFGPEIIQGVVVKGLLVELEAKYLFR